MNRRLKTLSRDPVYFILLILGMLVSHFTWSEYDSWDISLYPLPFLFAAFIGYKYGKNSLLVAITVVFTTFLAWKLFYFEELVNENDEELSVLFSDSLFVSDTFQLRGQSVWVFVAYYLVGLITCKTFDHFEVGMNKISFNLDLLLPYERKYYLENLFNACRYCFANTSDTGPIEAQANLTLPYGVKINLKILFKRILLTLSVVLIFAVNAQLTWNFTEYMTIRPIPVYSSLVLVLIFCWFRG